MLNILTRSDGEAIFSNTSNAPAVRCRWQWMELEGSIIQVISISGSHGTRWTKQNYPVSHLSSTLYITAPTPSTLQVSPQAKMLSWTVDTLGTSPVEAKSMESKRKTCLQQNQVKLSCPVDTMCLEVAVDTEATADPVHSFLYWWLCDT